MVYKFFINDVDVTPRVEIGANVKERFAEELDVGSLTLSFWDTGGSIKALSRVDIVELEDDGETEVKRYHMLVISDNVEPITKMSPLRYRHELSLIELTHKLDYSIINALSFSQPIEDLVTAPFTSIYTTTIGNNVFDGMEAQANAACEFPKIPPIFSRYESDIEIKSVDKAKIWVASQNQNDPALLLGEFDLTLNLFRIDEVVNVNNEITQTDILLQTVNLSQNDFVVTNLSPAKYAIEIGLNESFVLFGSQNTNINRKYKYFVEINNRFEYTLLDVVNKIRDLAPLEKKSIHSQTRLFNLSQELQDKLANIKSPQIYIEKLTSREALNEALKYVNAISRLVRTGNDDVLTANFFNDRKGTYQFNLPEIFSTSSSQDALNYTSNNRSFLRNAINTNELNNPSVNELGSIYKGLRSSAFQVLPENGQLVLSYNIYRIVSVKAKVNVRLFYQNIDDGLGTSTRFERIEELDVDLTPYVVEKNILNIARKINDVFGTAGDLRRYNRNFFRDREIELSSYSFGDNIIDFGGTVGSLFARTKFQRIIEGAVAEQLTYRQGERFRNPDGTFPTEILNGSKAVLSDNNFNPNGNVFSANQSTPLGIANNDYLTEIPVNATYIALEDNIIDSHKEDTTIIDKYTEKVNNINARIVNYQRASVNNYGIAQRLGVPTVSYGKMIRFTDEENVGDLNQNNEIVVEKDNIFYIDHKVAAYEASRDFNRLSQFVKVDRAFRPFENPLNRDIIDRNDIYTEYLEYSTSDENIQPRPNDTLISSIALRTIINTLRKSSNEPKDYVKLVILRTDGFLKQNPEPTEFISHGLLIPVIAQGGKNTLSFRFGFKSNISAGDFIRVNNDESISTIQDLFNRLVGNVAELFDENYSSRPYGLWREFITYGDKNGFFDEMHFKMLTDFSIPPTYGNEGYFKETQFLPLVKSTAANNFTYFAEQNVNLAFENAGGKSFSDAFIIKKNTSEIYSFTYQVSFTPATIEDNEKIIIGRKMSDENLLVFPFKEKTMKLHLYGDFTKRYSKFDDEFVIPSEQVINLENNMNVLSFAGRPYGIEITTNLTNVTHWAIADEDGNLYLANNTNNKYVFFEPRNKRSTINYNW